MNTLNRQLSSIAVPRQLWVGAILIAFAWPLNWVLPGLRTHLLFFPLWVGYCLLIDGIVLLRKGTSQLTRSWKGFVSLFLVSAPAWWLFELINWRTQNWQYVGREYFSDFTYGVLATLSFSTVMPAVFGTAELLSTFGWVKHLKSGPRIPLSQIAVTAYFVLGLGMLALLILWPRYFFPLVWLSIFFIIEPINIWLGGQSLSYSLEHGNWRPTIVLWIGALICGFIWEMWNFWSYPKWVYHVPFVGFWHVFEMPLLGYGGYLPFGMELFALYQLVSRLIPAGWRSELRLT